MNLGCLQTSLAYVQVYK